MVSHVISYAQNREDLILDGFFTSDEKGFYVDVGANSPDVDSVTKLFYDKGWQGMNIEPLKSHFAQLKKYRPRDINLNIGISNKPGTLELREYEGTGLSTFSKGMKNTYTEAPNVFTKRFIDHKVQMHTLASVFKQQHITAISFLKVDVEGFEYEVLEGNDWDKYRPEVICIEANHIEKDWHPLLKDYELAFFDGLNEYFVDKHKPERMKRFSYIDAIIFKEPIVGYRLLPELVDLERSQAHMKELEKELDIKNQHIAHLDGLIQELTPLRRHFKRQVKGKFRALDERMVRRLSSKRSYTPGAIVEGEDLLAVAKRADYENFKRYNTSTKIGVMLALYLGFRRTMVRILSMILGGRI
ncbi:MAG TPA: FkbM family methyltransferase [Patescibacteria group bacterium]|nr:FkbM family methyltransferase [Patescibacteria group bacterium]